MATIGATYQTMLDYAKRLTPDGQSIADVIEVLAASNPIVADANVMEGNMATGHMFVQRTSQPTGSWRKLNYGVAAEKSTTDQFTDFCAILESYSEVDVDIASLGGNAAAYRASEDMAFVAGMGGTLATALFYGNQGTDPEQPHGLSPRYNSTTGSTGSQIIDCSGSGSDNTSIWLITWGERTCSLIYPKGSQAGLVQKDMGATISTDSNSLKHEVYTTKFQWKVGLTIPDYRHVIRICNIDVSDLTNDAATGADLVTALIDAYYARPTEVVAMEEAGMAKSYWYCNKTIAAYLHKQALVPTNVVLTLDTVAGKPFTRALGAPVRICDAIVNTEAAVS